MKCDVSPPSQASASQWADLRLPHWAVVSFLCPCNYIDGSGVVTGSLGLVLRFDSLFRRVPRN